MCYFSLPMERAIESRISRAIDEKVFPGCVVGYVGRNTAPVVLAFGRHTYDSDSVTMSSDSIFDVASITKSIPTSSLALQSIDRGALALDDRVVDFVPEISFSKRNDVLIRHLLTHTLACNVRMSSLKDSGPDGILDALFSTELAADPGTSYFYSNATSILLGMVVEKIRGESLSVCAQRELFEPLGMTKTSFFPERFLRNTIVPTEIDPWRSRTIQGEIHDESSWVLRQTMVAGSAGLFSTVGDILRFLAMLLDNGYAKGTRYFSEKCVGEMCANQIPHLGLQTGLGWELNQTRYMGGACTPYTIGKTGFTGCVCMADLAAGTGLALLSNYTYPFRKPDRLAIDAVRREIADIVFRTING